MSGNEKIIIWYFENAAEKILYQEEAECIINNEVKRELVKYEG